MSPRKTRINCAHARGPAKLARDMEADGRLPPVRLVAHSLRRAPQNVCATRTYAKRPITS